MNIVGYCRFSSDGQRDGYSIEAQQKAIIDYCKFNNYNLIKFYIDEARSGTNDNRIAFQEMISDSEQQIFQAVVVHKLDRFSRDRYDSVIYRKKLRDNGVKLLSVLERIDEDNPEDLILLSVLEGMASYYSKNLSREVKKGMNAAARKGQSVGSTPPLGYLINKETKKYEINELEAPIIAKIFELYIKYNSYKPIQEELKSLEMKSRRGLYFSQEQIRRILKNETYIGNKLWNQYKLKTAKNMNNNQQDDLIRVENAHPAIIDQDTFYKAQELINTKQNKLCGRKRNYNYMLTGLVYCADCGTMMRGFSSKKYKSCYPNGKIYTYYMCPMNNRKRPDKKCTTSQIDKTKLEKATISAIINLLNNESILNELVSKMERNIDEINKKDYSNEILLISNKVKKLNDKKQKLLDTYLDGILEKDEYLDKKQELETKLIALDKEKEKISKITDLSCDHLIYAINLLLNKLSSDELSDDSKKEIISIFVHKIVVSNDSVDIYFKLPLNEVAFNTTYGRAYVILNAVLKMYDVRYAENILPIYDLSSLDIIYS